MMQGKGQSKNMMIRAQKRTVSNTILGKRGKDTIRNRHAIPMDIEGLFKAQEEYGYIEPPVS